MTTHHEHAFGPLRFGKRLGIAQWEGLKDPCACGLTFDDFLKHQFAQLQATAEMLTRAMEQENVPPDLASRILHRFLYGDPRGLDAGPMAHPDADEITNFHIDTPPLVPPITGIDQRSLESVRLGGLPPVFGRLDPDGPFLQPEDGLRAQLARDALLPKREDDDG